MMYKIFFILERAIIEIDVLFLCRWLNALQCIVQLQLPSKADLVESENLPPLTTSRDSRTSVALLQTASRVSVSPESNLPPVTTARDSRSSVVHTSDVQLQTAPQLGVLHETDERQCVAEENPYDDLNFSETVKSGDAVEDNIYDDVDCG